MSEELPKNLTIDAFKTLVGQGVQLVDFWAPWCGPCKMIAPILDELTGEFEGKAKIVKLNVDDNQDVAQHFGVMSIPTLLLFKDGQKVDQMVGAQSKPKLKAFIENAL